MHLPCVRKVLSIVSFVDDPIRSEYSIGTQNMSIFIINMINIDTKASACYNAIQYLKVKFKLASSHEEDT